MTTEQKNRLAMANVTRVLLAAATETAGIISLPARFAGLTALLAEIAALETRQADVLRCQIVERDTLLEEMIGATIALAGIGLSYADAHELAGLSLEMKISAYNFERLRLAERPVLAQRIVDKITPVLSRLAEQGVTQAMLDDLQMKIDAAAEAVTASRTTVAAKRAATERLAAAFRKLTAVLENQLDPLIAPLRKTQPEFHARYVAARKIVARPATRRAATEPANA